MSSESEGKDSFDLATQFDKVPQDMDEGADPQVNVNLEVALEHGLMSCEPEAQPVQETEPPSKQSEVSVSILSSDGNILH